MKKPSLELVVGICLFVVSGILFIISPQRIWCALADNLNLILWVLFLGLIVAIVATTANHLIPVQFAQRHLTQNKLSYLFLAGLFGVLTPGPIYAIYPIILILKKKGIHNSILVSYITGQTIIGPARIPLEVGLLGPKFFGYRLALALVFSPLAGVLYTLLSHPFPDRINPEITGE